MSIGLVSDLCNPGAPGRWRKLSPPAPPGTRGSVGACVGPRRACGCSPDGIPTRAAGVPPTRQGPAPSSLTETWDSRVWGAPHSRRTGDKRFGVQTASHRSSCHVPPKWQGAISASRFQSPDPRVPAPARFSSAASQLLPLLSPASFPPPPPPHLPLPSFADCEKVHAYRQAVSMPLHAPPPRVQSDRINPVGRKR